VTPVLGDINRPETFQEAAAECSVLVHAASDYARNVVGPDRAAIEAFLLLGHKGARPKTLIYTSGVWVYGETRDGATDETTPLKPLPLVAWRPTHEDRVLAATSVKGLVVRPGCVYGKSGGLTGMWFEAASKNIDVTVVGDGHNRWATVHVDDLADAYVRLAESGLRGEVFNVTDRSRDRVGDMAAAALRAAGGRGSVRTVSPAEAETTMGPLAHGLAVDQHIGSWKIARHLGWNPSHGGFVDGVKAYFEAWQARR
jgi:nucleoside-diphosphate-sugar epimerase